MSHLKSNSKRDLHRKDNEKITLQLVQRVFVLENFLVAFWLQEKKKKEKKSKTEVEGYRQYVGKINCEILFFSYKMG